MTREEFAVKIHWQKIISVIGIMNAFAEMPQLWQLLTTKVTTGLSIQMFVIFLVVQFGFTLHGFFTRDKVLMYTIGLSAFVSTLTISVALYYRSLGQ